MAFRASKKENGGERRDRQGYSNRRVNAVGEQSEGHSPSPPPTSPPTRNAISPSPPKPAFSGRKYAGLVADANVYAPLLQVQKSPKEMSGERVPGSLPDRRASKPPVPSRGAPCYGGPDTNSHVQPAFLRTPQVSFFHDPGPQFVQFPSPSYHSTPETVLNPERFVPMPPHPSVLNPERFDSIPPRSSAMPQTNYQDQPFIASSTSTYCC